MLQHDYPPWHRPAQKGFFVVAVLLSIALPVVYGSSRRPRKISARTMGVVLGTYFGLWALFSLVVRFLIPSPKIEPTLPTYTPSPIPVPATLHSPSRPNAVPTSPAIRLHPTGSAVAPDAAAVPRSGSELGAGPRVTVTAPGGGRRAARFADDSDDTDGENNSSPSRYSSFAPGNGTGPGSRNSNNVTFQARPRGYTADSAHSAEFPTFAAYRQSQHGNFDALAQRFKRAFAISQQTNEQQLQRQQMAMMQSPASSGVESTMTSDPPSYSQSAVDPSGSSTTGVPLTGATLTTGASGTGTPTAAGTRSRSTSAASMFSDIAGRLRSGSLFSRSNNTNTTNTITPTRTSTDPLHYTHISSSANSDTIPRPSLLSSDSVSYPSYPSSPNIPTRTGSGPGTGAASTTTVMSPEAMPTLELLESKSPTSQPGHDRTPTRPLSVSSQDRQSHSSIHNYNTLRGEDVDQDEESEGVVVVSSPQPQSQLASPRKHSEKHTNST